ncbi:hypothetical protein AB0M45_09405 [Nocardia sp. NPDC051787]|uniref:hypothetical protein n=1 Tax=Nocardia sp. NPDC051787 TaxID=3155415 RepID=UPI00342A56D1
MPKIPMRLIGTASGSRRKEQSFPAQDLRQLLVENPSALQVSDGQRERAVEFLLKLNAQALNHDQQVRMTRRGEHATLGYRIGDAQWHLSLAEDHVDPYGQRVEPWEIRSSYRRARPTGKLRLTISSQSVSDKNVWLDEKRAPLERRIGQIIEDVKASFDEANRRREEAHHRWLAQKAEYERKRAAEQLEWETALAAARPKAVAMLQRRTLFAALGAWRAARDLREICALLDGVAVGAQADGDAERAANLRSWCAAGRKLAERLDPTIGPASLGTITVDIEPGPDDMRPYLNGWRPDGPYKDYHRKSIDELSLSRPRPTDWDLGELP